MSAVMLHLGERGCGKPAFRRDCIPAPAEPISPKGITHLDGTPVRGDELITCDSCNARLSRSDLDIRHFREE